MVFLGLWFFMATLSGYSRRHYWSVMEIHPFDGAPYRFHAYMSLSRFEAILRNLGYTNVEKPKFVDKFWEVRQMIEQWNVHMREIFSPSWVSCLDESMSIWFSKWTCPGWMFVPRKPHPYGNEYHSIGCGLSGILYQIELVEGKDEPPVYKKEKKHPKGNTTGLLLRLTKSLYGTGKVVVLDSGFCVLQALLELKKVGIYAHAVIKKRRFWPKYCNGDKIDEHMREKNVGDVDVATGILDNIKFNIFAMKESDYSMKLMSTYGDLVIRDDEDDTRRIFVDPKTNKITEKKFKYTMTYSNHFRYRHAVDDHNNIRHSSPALEETWVTHRWANRVFAFLLALTEVNAFLCLRYFVWTKSDSKKSKKTTFHQFRKELAQELLCNTYISSMDTKFELQEVRRESKRLKRAAEHELMTAPKRAKKYLGNAKWDFSATEEYPQRLCTGFNCKKRIRTYCSCSVGIWLCLSCHHKHCRSVFTSDNGSD